MHNLGSDVGMESSQQKSSSKTAKDPQPCNDLVSLSRLALKLDSQDWAGNAERQKAKADSDKSCSCRRQVVQQVVKALNRPALHAKTLGFEHPVSKEKLEFTSALPDDFQTALDRLRAVQ